MQGDRHPSPFEPRWPLLAAVALLTIWIAILSLPMWSGAFLAGPFSDQYATGYAYRHWAANQWRLLGHVPLWNPEIFGGMPFVAAMHGDIFYPTAWLRLLVPTAVAMNIGFVVHYVLAGVFVYILVRLLGGSWVGAVVGGTAYQLSGVIGSYVQPGHDGKTFVTALLPLAFVGLVLAFRKKRLEGHGIVALAVGLGVLSPHPQMLYYMLVAAGIFALYLAFGESGGTTRTRVTNLALALGAVAVGMGIGMIQIFPFFHYIPFSPRAEGYYGFEGATSFAIPWAHVPEFFFAGFVGSREGYWGPNPLKLHSEYLGLPVVALAVLGALAKPRRRLAMWLGAIGALFLLVALGAGTPFYRLWWSVMPFMKQVRAPGMALYLVAFVVAVFAAFGVERLERGEAGRHPKVWLGVAGAVALLALAGVLGALAETLAQGIEMASGRPAVSAAAAGRVTIRNGALMGAVTLGILAGAHWLWQRRTLPVAAFGLVVVVAVGGDLWWNARSFWTYSRAPETLFSIDPITEQLTAAPEPYRVLDLGVYPGASLMARGIAQLLGHHGNELHRFDELMGGKNQWRNAGRRVLWDLYGIEYLIVPSDLSGADSIPGYSRVLDDVETSANQRASLFQRSTPARYARAVPAALQVPDDQAIPTVLDPRFDPDRVLILDPAAAHAPRPITVMPEPLDMAVSFESWEPGGMVMRVEPVPERDVYLMVGENWYPDWQAEVDGRPAEVLRGNYSLIAVPLAAGSERVVLRFDSAEYRAGKIITLLSALIAAFGLIVPPVLRRR